MYAYFICIYMYSMYVYIIQKWHDIIDLFQASQLASKEIIYFMLTLRLRLKGTSFSLNY